MNFRILPLTLFFFSGLLSAQSWQAIDLGASTNVPNGAMAVHNGKLFVANVDKKLQVSTNGTTFTDVTTDTLAGEIRYLQSAGNRLYLSAFNPSYASSTIWYSEDEGQSWFTDTVGLPNNFVQATLKRDTYLFISYANGQKLFGLWGSANGYYQKDINAASWTKLSSLDAINPTQVAAKGDTLLVVNSSKVYYSTDDGANWTALNATGLPAFFVPKGFSYAEGNIFLGADATIQQEFKLFKSDDFGSTWDTLAINHLLGKNWLSQAQRPKTISARGSHIFVSLDNNKNNTPMNMVSSTDGGNTFNHDTAGFKADPFGTGTISQFAYFSGKVFALNNFQTLYYRSMPLGLYEQNTAVNLYPNPTRDKVILPLTLQNEEIRIFNIHGQLLLTAKLEQALELDLSAFPSGTYLIRSKDYSQKIIKL